MGSSLRHLAPMVAVVLLATGLAQAGMPAASATAFTVTGVTAGALTPTVGTSDQLTATISPAAACSTAAPPSPSPSCRGPPRARRRPAR